jgi:hypothetical protein
VTFEHPGYGWSPNPRLMAKLVDGIAGIAPTPNPVWLERNLLRRTCAHRIEDHLAVCDVPFSAASLEAVEIPAEYIEIGMSTQS